MRLSRATYFCTSFAHIAPADVFQDTDVSAETVATSSNSQNLFFVIETFGISYEMDISTGVLEKMDV